MTSGQPELRAHCIAASPERAEAIEALARVIVPAARISHATRPGLPTGAPLPDVVVVDIGTCGATAPEGADASGAPADLEAVRRLRAGGFTGAILVLGEEASSPDAPVEDELSRLGATRASTARFAAALTSAFTLALQPRAADPGTTELIAELGRTRQLLSAGEIAIGLQHSMNNPLAAILAESQLLEMDALSAEQREAVARIVALCRRMTAVVRRLDGVGRPLGGGPSATSDR